MASLNWEVRKRLPATVALILTLAEHIPLEELLTMKATTLLRASDRSGDWILITEDISHYWIPALLHCELDMYCWWRRKDIGAHVRLSDLPDHRRMFKRGSGVAVSSGNVFSVVARAIRHSQ